LGGGELGARELSARQLGARELGARELGAREPGAREPGARELGAQDPAGPCARLGGAPGVGLGGPVSSVGPLLDELRDDFGLQGPPGALLPALPLLCFGLLAPIAPALSRRLGLHRAVLAGAAVLALGLALRNVGVPGLFLGTLLVGSGIAVVNVLLSAVVKPTSPTGCRWRPP